MRECCFYFQAGNLRFDHLRRLDIINSYAPEGAIFVCHTMSGSWSLKQLNLINVFFYLLRLTHRCSLILPSNILAFLLDIIFREYTRIFLPVSKRGVRGGDVYEAVFRLLEVVYPDKLVSYIRNEYYLLDNIEGFYGGRKVILNTLTQRNKWQLLNSHSEILGRERPRWRRDNSLSISVDRHDSGRCAYIMLKNSSSPVLKGVDYWSILECGIEELKRFYKNLIIFPHPRELTGELNSFCSGSVAVDSNANADHLNEILTSQDNDVICFPSGVIIDCILSGKVPYRFPGIDYSDPYFSDWCMSLKGGIVNIFEYFSFDICLVDPGIVIERRRQLIDELI